MKSIAVALILAMLCGCSSQWPFGLTKKNKELPADSGAFRREVYYNEQTVAVVDLDELNRVQNCNVIEVYEREEAISLLTNLSTRSYPQKKTFAEMITLMELCDLIEKLSDNSNVVSPKGDALADLDMRSNYYTIFSGILPGTKWCGIGDIATSYYDLGPIANVDRCCRNHDLCPIKVRAYKKRYGLSNSSFYSKSHCDCDEILYRCLKSQNHKIAETMGKIYFNIMKVPCIEDVPVSERILNGSKFRFTVTKREF